MKDPKDVKTTYFKMRLTEREKEILKEKAEERNITMCELVKLLCEEIWQDLKEEK